MPRPAIADYDAAIVSACAAALAELGVAHVVDKKCASIDACTAAEATIVASRAALRHYDAFHPERIACILVRRAPDAFT